MGTTTSAFVTFWTRFDCHGSFPRGKKKSFRQNYLKTAVFSNVFDKKKLKLFSSNSKSLFQFVLKLDQFNNRFCYQLGNVPIFFQLFNGPTPTDWSKTVTPDSLVNFRQSTASNSKITAFQTSNPEIPFNSFRNFVSFHKKIIQKS